MGSLSLQNDSPRQILLSSLPLTERGTEAQRGDLTCPKPHSKQQSRDLNPARPVPGFVLSISLPCCLLLHLLQPLLKGPRLRSWDYLCSPLPCEAPGNPLAIRLAVPRCLAPCSGHRASGNDGVREHFCVQPNSLLPSKAGQGNQPKTQVI